MSTILFKKVRENIRHRNWDSSCFSLTEIPKSFTNYTGNASFVTLILIFGHCSISINKSDIVCSNGNILLIKGPCTYTITKKVSASDIFILDFNQGFFDVSVTSQVVDCPIFYDFIRLDNSMGEFLFFDCSIKDMIHHYTMILLYEASIQDEKTERSVKSSLVLFLTNLHRVHHQNLVISVSTMMEDYAIGSFLKYMTANYADVTLVSIAKHFNFHPAYFSHLFKSLSGYTFTEKLLMIKLEHAKRFLVTSNLSIQEIVEMIGFKEKSYFHKCFKKYYGVTPGMYRKEHSKIN